MANPLQKAFWREINLGAMPNCGIYSLPALEEQGLGRISRLPVSLRIVLESLLRNCDGQRILERHVRELAAWQPTAPRHTEIPFVVGRIVLQDVAGIPLLGDLAAMRSAAKRASHSPALVEPRVPVDMVIDHTLAVDYHASPDSMQRNMQLEIERNEERFRFVKWAMQAFRGIRLIPPGFGILHQVNLEFLARGLLSKHGVYYPDTLVGTDSHTGMIAGLGVVGWGVGGIEAEAAMLGQPVYVLTPDVVGVHVVGEIRPGVTATDVVLHVTQMMRGAKVVGKFVEFFGEGAARLTVPDRATIANMAPEYGATIGFFPVDEQTCRYFRETGRSEKEVAAVKAYFRAQGCFGTPRLNDVDYSQVLLLDLAEVSPSVAGPKRPQDRIPLPELKARFESVLQAAPTSGGYGKRNPDVKKRYAVTQDIAKGKRDNREPPTTGDGDVLIAAITSCTNTSNPGVMLTAGLVAKKAAERGLRVRPWVKTSLAPGSVVVSKYFEVTGLQQYLDTLGFGVVGYGCTTCVGNSGPIDPDFETAVTENNVVACAVLSGNRNFEARIHPAIRAAFLMSPPLVIAFALAGSVNVDLTREPLGRDAEGKPVYLRDIWPTQEELARVIAAAANPRHYQAAYGVDFSTANPLWESIPQMTGEIYPWDAGSSYIKEPPFLVDSSLMESTLRPLHGARALAILGDSVTTDHISPIGDIKATSPAGRYLRELGVAPSDFNNYGARRMNHEVMVRGTFANIRLKNLMVPGVEGGITVHQPSGERMSIFDAAVRYGVEGTSLLIIAGEEYGTGSARDWAAKGTRLLGVRAVIARSFERIHRSNLVGMGVLPCQFGAETSAASLKLDGSEEFDLVGLDENARPRQPASLIIRRKDGRQDSVPLTLRIDTTAELEYVKRGGILPYVFSGITSRNAG